MGVSVVKIDKMVTAEHYTNNGSEYPLDKKSREYHGLVYTHNCSTRNIIDGRTYMNTNGSVTFLPMYKKYRVELPDNYMSCYVINFFGEVDCDYMNLYECEDMFSLFEEAVRIWRRHREDEYYRLDCASITYKIFAELCRRRDRSGPPLRKKERLAPVIEKIHNEYNSPGLKISELAPFIGVGERYLCNIFKEIYGMPPKRYLVELRIKRAKELLSGNIPVSEVARLVGFGDVYHFSNIFKNECGIPPSEYRADRPVV